jgi:hypothetical protein
MGCWVSRCYYTGDLRYSYQYKVYLRSLQRKLTDLKYEFKSGQDHAPNEHVAMYYGNAASQICELIRITTICAQDPSHMKDLLAHLVDINHRIRRQDLSRYWDDLDSYLRNTNQITDDIFNLTYVPKIPFVR